ncbi:C2H2 type zinc finger domain protein [Aulographum hederae CBS 113979]|uniref:C2H2 type zinc finger domain protein n=1 Tax=Aulographum hederae CBS 113979 TaxID=1176131 RepID=A0A6G1H5A6_9PEZI|nr:C2H2 type zinc finger domain protein [Aulographum hederae CBS 113979]
MQCRYCPREFSKGEHLRRHERSHTGSRPFVCKICKRPFGRQDSLMRHERLHTRPDGGKSPFPPQFNPMNRPITPITPDSADREDTDLESHPSPTEECQINTGDCNAPQPQPPAPASSMDLDFELMWPDSEDLFQLITSPNSSMLHTESISTWDNSAGSPRTFNDQAPSIENLPSGGNQKAVSDVSKMVARWSSSITAAAESSTLTSTFLDECLHMFFVRFIPTFPVLHRATFVFRECIHPLLLNAVAIGSLYLGPKDAVSKGEVLWRLAHTAVTTSWHTLIGHRGPNDACSGVQLIITALLGQIYGSLSKNRAIRTMSQAFHGLGFTWAHSCGLYESEQYDLNHLPDFTASNQDKDRQWRVWIAREIQQRSILSHYILDGLVAKLYGSGTAVRHASNQLTTPGSEAAFSANTAEEWLCIMRGELVNKITFKSIYRMAFSSTGDSSAIGYSLPALSLKVVLEGMQCFLSDNDDDEDTPIGIPSRADIRRALARIYDCITQNPTLSSTERLEIHLRWHSISLDTTANTTLLGRHICSNYNIEQHIWPNIKAGTLAADPATWANTPDARRALLHAFAIQDIVEQLPRGRAHAINMPSALFTAATVYAVYPIAGNVNVRIPTMVDWNDVLCTTAGSNMALTASAGFPSTTTQYVRGDAVPDQGLNMTTRNLLYEFNSMQKLFGCLKTQWGVASDMEQVIDQWIRLCH